MLCLWSNGPQGPSTCANVPATGAGRSRPPRSKKIATETARAYRKLAIGTAEVRQQRISMDGMSPLPRQEVECQGTAAGTPQGARGLSESLTQGESFGLSAVKADGLSSPPDPIRNRIHRAQPLQQSHHRGSRKNTLRIGLPAVIGTSRGRMGRIRADRRPGDHRRRRRRVLPDRDRHARK